MMSDNKTAYAGKDYPEKGGNMSGYAKDIKGVLIVGAMVFASIVAVTRVWNERIPMTGFPTIDSGIYPDPHVEEVYLEEANLFEGLTQNEYEKIVKAVADKSVPEVYLEEANLFEGLTQNEYEKIVKAVVDKSVPFGAMCE